MSDEQSAAPRFLTLQQVAELNISLSQTCALVRSGDLRGIQIGDRNQWRIDRVMLSSTLPTLTSAAENRKDFSGEPPIDDQALAGVASRVATPSAPGQVTSTCGHADPDHHG